MIRSRAAGRGPRQRWARAGLAHAGLAMALLLLPAVAAVRVALGQWPGGDTVIETVHNLSRTAQVAPMSGFIANYQQACVYCHHPHGTSGNRPIWNRDPSNAAFQMYESGSLNMPIDPRPAEASMLCLSCHEGSIPLDRVQVKPAGFGPGGGNGETIKRCATDCHTGGNPAGGFNWEQVWFEPDLRKQHPISIVYDPALDPDFQPTSTVEAAGLRLVDGKVECMTCHEPHSQRYRPFLRIGNTTGSLCLVCHRSPPGRSTAHFW